MLLYKIMTDTENLIKLVSIELWNGNKLTSDSSTLSYNKTNQAHMV